VDDEGICPDAVSDRRARDPCAPGDLAVVESDCDELED
jgi:hypothetical protein